MGYKNIEEKNIKGGIYEKIIVSYIFVYDVRLQQRK